MRSYAKEKHMTDRIEQLRSIEQFWLDRLERGSVQVQSSEIYPDYTQYAAEAGLRLASRRTFETMIRLLEQEMQP
jgi:hypothetical protein